MKLLIIIPAYNEEENIERVVNNLIDNYPQYDYLVVNDGSKDNTANICRDNNYNFLDLPINLGLAGGFQAGIRYAYEHGYDAALQFDGDGQHQPQYIAEMLQVMEEESADIVIGSRFVTDKKPKSMRMLGSNIIQAAIRLTTGRTMKDPTSGMRLLNRRVLREFAYTMNYGPEPDTISYLMRCGVKVREVQVEMLDRVAGESYLNLKRSIWYMIRMCSSIVFIQRFRKRRV
ncbi:glycosyltransferase [Lachnospiraceae bacterium KM106-2]|nr:glycosyltransferase [Lachnospiraceae bacterium KM106-2]